MITEEEKQWRDCVIADFESLQKRITILEIRSIAVFISFILLAIALMVKK